MTDPFKEFFIEETSGAQATIALVPERIPAFLDPYAEGIFRCAQAVYIVKRASEEHFRICYTLPSQDGSTQARLIFNISEAKEYMQSVEKDRDFQEAELSRLDLRMAVQKLEERKLALESRLERLRREEVNYGKWLAAKAEQRRLRLERERYEREMLDRQLKEKQDVKRAMKEVERREREQEEAKRRETEMKKELIKARLLKKLEEVKSGEAKGLNMEIDTDKVTREFELAKHDAKNEDEKKEANKEESKKQEPVAVPAQNRYETLAICYDLLEGMVQTALRDRVSEPMVCTAVMAKAADDAAGDAKKKWPTSVPTNENKQKPSASEPMVVSEKKEEAKKEPAPVPVSIPKEEKVTEAKLPELHQKWEEPKGRNEALQDRLGKIFQEHNVEFGRQEEDSRRVALPVDLALYLSLWQEVNKQAYVANRCLMHVFSKRLDILFHLNQLRRYMLCDAGDVMHTFLIRVYGESAFQLFPVTAVQLNNAFQGALKMHARKDTPRLRFVPNSGVAPDKAQIFSPLDVIPRISHGPSVVRKGVQSRVRDRLPREPAGRQRGHGQVQPRLLLHPHRQARFRAAISLGRRINQLLHDLSKRLNSAESRVSPVGDLT